MQLIFEIGCEELPASFCKPALAQIETIFRERVADLRLEFGALHALATPRRLVLLVEDLDEKQPDIEEERTGPPASVAFKDGEPTKAALGFARGQGVDPADLYTVETKKGEYLAAKVFEAGRPARELLPAVLNAIIEKLNFPKSMRWAARKERFARPVRWILALLDGEVLPVEFAGVKSQNTTRGHRFAAPDSFEVSDLDSYLSGLKNAHVILDQAARRQLIVEKLAEVSKDLGAELIDDPDLIDEVTFLVEEPHAIAVEFGDEYLELPDEVLISSMRSHQRYFSLKNPETGRLASACVVIYNTPVRAPEQVKKGNLRVLQARLDDARFFWEKDQKMSLEERLEQLKDVVWLQKLGSMRARSERMAHLASALADALGFDEETKTAASRAALLSKTDLITDMVGEFPDLQGLMGKEYALADGEDPAVAQAIYEQYLPRGAEDTVPGTDAGALVALAEKLDALTGCFGVGLIPTSTSDPYALRRAALGVIRILEERAYSIPLTKLLRLAIAAYVDQAKRSAQENLEVAPEKLIAQWLEFAGTRLKYQLSADFGTDLVDAVLAADKDDVLSARDRVRALFELRDEPDFEPLAAGFKRVVNILKKQAEAYAGQALKADPDIFTEAQETQLYQDYLAARETTAQALKDRDWSRAFKALIALKKPVDDFFDHVMVMSDDQALRQNRIALLAELRELFLQVADISHIDT